MTVRIGVYICECGPNMGDAMDIGAVVSAAGAMEKVVMARPYGILCSGEGREFLGRDIREQQLNRVVVAGCTPKEHEETFRAVLRGEGINPAFLQIANIREQCAWVTEGREAATEKAVLLVRAAVKRVALHDPLEEKEIDVKPDALVVGAGITGISAALELAAAGRKVTLVEKDSFIGGRVARYEEIFPNMECATCMIDPVLDAVLHDGNIEIVTGAEVDQLLGYYGRFTARVRQRPRFVDLDACIGCGACFEACPVKVSNRFNEGMGEHAAVAIPYAGALPNAAAIDGESCLRSLGGECTACRDACLFGAIDYGDAEKIRHIEAGAVVAATGFDLFDPAPVPQYGAGEAGEVYTSLAFERILSSTGPTEGAVRCRDGRTPRAIALVHCVGSRNSRFNEHCSGICCTTSLKFASLIKEKLPHAEVTLYHSELCLPGGEAQRFLSRLRATPGVLFRRVESPESLTVTEGKEGIDLFFVDGAGSPGTGRADMAVLLCALEGSRDAPGLAALCDVSCGESRFFAGTNPVLEPHATVRDGILAAGCARLPQDIAGCIADGRAAAGRILSRLHPGGKLKLKAETAFVDASLCAACLSCLSVCPYRALSRDGEEGTIQVNELLCRGCGSCAGACPSGAIGCHHFTDRQISAEIGEVLHGRA